MDAPAAAPREGEPAPSAPPLSGDRGRAGAGRWRAEGAGTAAPSGARTAGLRGRAVSELVQEAVTGSAPGGIYARLASALGLVYRSSHIVNFAQGERATLSTYVAWQLIDWGLPFWGA